MKVLAIFSTDRILGGGEISFTLSLRLVQDGGCRVLAVIPAEGPLSEYLRKNGIACSCAAQDSLRPPGNWRYLWRPPASWHRLGREFQPDLIHCNAVRPALYGQALARRLGVPCIFHARKAEKDPWVDGFLLRTMDAILCISQVVRRRFSAGPENRKLRVIYNPVDAASLAVQPESAAELRCKWGGQHEKLVGVIGRLSPVKGQQRMIEAAPEVLRRAPGTRFVFVGSEDSSWPGYRTQLQDNIRKAGLEGRFVFAGFCEDIGAAYHALDLVAFPTVSEGLGRVVLEAGATGKPIVTSNIEVLREILSPGLADLTVPLDQVEALGRRVAELLLDAELSSSVASRLQEHVRHRFSPESHAWELQALYRELVSR